MILVGMLLVRWRRQYCNGELACGAAPLRLVPLRLSALDVPTEPPAPASSWIEQAEIRLLNAKRLSVAATIHPVVLTRLVQVLNPS